MLRGCVTGDVHRGSKKQGVDSKPYRYDQNDILKSISLGEPIFPPKSRAPDRYLPVLQDGRAQLEYDQYLATIREVGSTAVQEVAFTLANAIAYIEAAIKAGMDVDEFADNYRSSSTRNFLEEIAKFRAARRLYAKIMRERFCAKNSKSNDCVSIPNS